MSTKTIAAKLLIKPHSTLWLSRPALLELLGPLPDNVRVVDEIEEATTAVVFAASAASVRDILTLHVAHLTAPAALWVAYPKGNRADINRDSLWPILSEYGLRPVTQVAVNEIWSALRFRPA